MTRRLAPTLFCLFCLFAAGAAAAQDAALILGNNRYDRLGRVPGAAGFGSAEENLREMGFAVSAARDGRAAQVVPLLDDFADGAAEAERLVVALTGRFVTDGDRTWLMLADAPYPTLFGLGDSAVSVDSLLRVLATRPGQALLAIGYDPDDDDAFGPFLREGLGDLAAPQGVTVMVGEVQQMVAFIRDELARPEADLMTFAERRRFAVSGFAPDGFVLMPGRAAVEPVIVAPDRPDPVADARAWAVAERADSVAGYRAYLDGFPDGLRAGEARDRIEAILAEPERDARLAEESLRLSVAERREIQRDLTLLGFNTRGVDGIFGRGTRAAIQNWQQENGYPQTAYLTREQISRLDGQAIRRQAELAAAEAAERESRERADRAFWEETGARGDEAGFRAYLDRYPDGLFADIARDAVERIDARRRDAAAAEDREDWRRAEREASLDGYRRYLRQQPDGAFRAEAEAAIARLQGPARPDPDQIAAARAEERNLRLNPITARLVEAKLSELGLDPGTVDGRFTDKTREAIRRYQDARGLPATGYLNQATVVRLLADSITDLQRR